MRRLATALLPLSALALGWALGYSGAWAQGLDPDDADTATPAASAAPAPEGSAAPSAASAASPASPSGAPAPPPAPAATPRPAGSAAKVLVSCRENVPDGVVRPSLTSRLEPERGLAGHTVWLVVDVVHGAGEQLLPEGFALTGGADALTVLEEERWFLPDPKGGTKTVVETASEKERAEATTVTSRARIPFVPLPSHPGTNALRLPAIPIAVARANGQVMTLCTKPFVVTVDDPIVNVVDPEVHPNPPPRPQREVWESLVGTLRTAGFLLPLFIALSALAVWWLRRPKPEVPKPKIPPWITATQQLDEVRRSGWLEDEKFNEYFDRVDHITRFYLGERYGFDGLESTSHEIRDALSRVYPPLEDPDRIHRFLLDSDFLKYAEVMPTREDCVQAIERAELIVHATTPRTEKGDREPKKKHKKKAGKSRRAA